MNSWATLKCPSGTASLQSSRTASQRNQTLTDLFAFAPIYNDLNVSIDSRAEIASGQLVSGGYYQGLGVRPVIGRTITDDDDKAGAVPVAVITYRYWKERFGLDPAILQKPAFLNGLPFAVIGVTSPGFESALGVVWSADVTLPLAAEPLISPRSSESNESWKFWLRIMGRLKPGATIEQARANFEPTVKQSAMESRRDYLSKYPDPEARSRSSPSSPVGTTEWTSHTPDRFRSQPAQFIESGRT